MANETPAQQQSQQQQQQTSPTVALFQKAHQRMVMLQRLDEQRQDGSIKEGERIGQEQYEEPAPSRRGADQRTFVERIHSGFVHIAAIT